MRQVTPLLLITACASISTSPSPSDVPAESPVTEAVGFHVPVDFRPECAYLKTLAAPPDDLTVGGFFGCLTDASRAQLDRAYQKKAARRAVPGAPADLDELVATFGEARFADAHLRDLAFGADARARFRLDVQEDGVAPAAAPDAKFGIQPTSCTGSCLSRTVDVVGASRVIALGPSQTGPTPTSGGRQLDQILPGSFPDHNQNTLANSELVASGCGPVSAVNLLEWWNIPVFHDGQELTSFDARTDYIADRMDTLDGINFTDDDDLFDFVETFPKQMYLNGHTSGYPGYHYMRSDSEAFKVMLSYLARGYPVIALYATSSESLHWAMVVGYENGYLHIANAPDLTLADFYAQWDSWQQLSWYATAASELFVDEDTFIAYTGWGPTTPEPGRFARRTSGAENPGYTSGGKTYAWRYCVGGNDDLGDAEATHVSDWPDEPDGSLPGYCMYEASGSPFTASASPAAGTVYGRKGSSITLAVKPQAGDGWASFIAANPGVECQFWGKTASSGSWRLLESGKCSSAGALSHAIIDDGTYSKVSFLVHSADFSLTTWTIKSR
jgi:hypothetical protein